MSVRGPMRSGERPRLRSGRRGVDPGRAYGLDPRPRPAARGSHLRLVWSASAPAPEPPRSRLRLAIVALLGLLTAGTFVLAGFPDAVNPARARRDA